MTRRQRRTATGHIKEVSAISDRKSICSPKERNEPVFRGSGVVEVAVKAVFEHIILKCGAHDDYSNGSTHTYPHSRVGEDHAQTDAVEDKTAVRRMSYDFIRTGGTNGLTAVGLYSCSRFKEGIFHCSPCREPGSE